LVKRNISLRKKFLLFVVLPTLLVAFYYSFWASDMFVSEARFSLRGPEGGGSTDLLAIFGQGSGSTTADAYVVQDYIRSMGLLNTLDENLELRQHYQSYDADIITRLTANSSAEEFHEYFRKIVQVMFDPASGIFTLKIRAYTPEMARDLGQAILEQSEQLVNRLRDRALHDALALAHTELTIAEEHVSGAREALKQFRQRSDLLNPEAAAGALLAMLANLEGEAVKARTEMAEAHSYLREDSAQIVALKARIAALEGQIVAEKNRLTGADQRVLNDVMADYERLTVDREFAEKRYVSALTSLEAARIRAEGKSRYLVAFSPPTLPEKSVWPRRLPFTMLAFAGATLLFGIVSLVIAAIREHAGF
jgi:capsular polysaccharide transport system permease protein